MSVDIIFINVGNIYINIYLLRCSYVLLCCIKIVTLNKICLLLIATYDRYEASRISFFLQELFAKNCIAL